MPMAALRSVSLQGLCVYNSTLTRVQNRERLLALLLSLLAPSSLSLSLSLFALCVVWVGVCVGVVRGVLLLAVCPCVCGLCLSRGPCSLWWGVPRVCGVCGVFACVCFAFSVRDWCCF